jgi:phosphatidylserine/phosphatidylglycerophosphate/cardiolipin synthase-like enzyme
MKRLKPALLKALAFFFFLTPAYAGETFYSPQSNLREIDLALIASAKSNIRFAGFVLTDKAIIHALSNASKRGIAVRVVLDKREYDNGYSLLKPILPLIRFKSSGQYMHLKSYLVDDSILRSGSANFSPAGLRRQDNDLTIESHRPDDALKFIEKFEEMWKEFTPHKQVSQNGCDIKGRITREGEKLYYLKAQRGYAQIKMNNAVWFCTIEQAISKGYIEKAPQK